MLIKAIKSREKPLLMFCGKRFHLPGNLETWRREEEGHIFSPEQPDKCSI
jgi:hypothetical protein